MKKRLHPNQLDLFAWADSRPSNVIDADHQFWLRRIRHALFRKRVQLGVYPEPQHHDGRVMEMRRA